MLNFVYASMEKQENSDMISFYFCRDSPGGRLYFMTNKKYPIEGSIRFRKPLRKDIKIRFYICGSLVHEALLGNVVKSRTIKIGKITPPVGGQTRVSFSLQDVNTGEFVIPDDWNFSCIDSYN